MLKLFAWIQVTSLAALGGLEARAAGRRVDRGSVTIQEVLWAVAAIAIVGIVVAAVKAFVTKESGKIK